MQLVHLGDLSNTWKIDSLLGASGCAVMARWLNLWLLLQHSPPLGKAWILVTLHCSRLIDFNLLESNWFAEWWRVLQKSILPQGCCCLSSATSVRVSGKMQKRAADTGCYTLFRFSHPLAPTDSSFHRGGSDYCCTTLILARLYANSFSALTTFRRIMPGTNTMNNLKWSKCAKSAM